MSIISLGFNFYEIILFSGDWEYGIVVGRYETVFMSNENYYHRSLNLLQKVPRYMLLFKSHSNLQALV